MKTQSMTRRTFIQDTFKLAAVAGTATWTGAGWAAGKDKAGSGRIRLGGPVSAKSDDPEVVAAAHRQLGYGAAYCPNVPLRDTAKIRAYQEAFARHEVVIAEVGRWCNLMEADSEKRRKNQEQVTEGLALAEAIGARCCVDIAGSFNPTSWFGPHPDNFSPAFFDAAVENARKIIDAVKPKQAKFCYEMMGWAMPESVDRCLKMIRAVDRPGFGVHLDPCNLINSPEKFYRNADLLKECFRKLGKYVVSCHAKDLTWDVEMNVHFREVRPGTGSVDYVTWLKELVRLPQQPPLMLEHLPNMEEYDKARRFILEKGKELGLEFA